MDLLLPRRDVAGEQRGVLQELGALSESERAIAAEEQGIQARDDHHASLEVDICNQDK